MTKMGRDKDGSARSSFRLGLQRQQLRERRVRIGSCDRARFSDGRIAGRDDCRSRASGGGRPSKACRRAACPRGADARPSRLRLRAGRSGRCRMIHSRGALLGLCPASLLAVPAGDAVAAGAPTSDCGLGGVNATSPDSAVAAGSCVTASSAQRQKPILRGSPRRSFRRGQFFGLRRWGRRSPIGAARLRSACCFPARAGRSSSPPVPASAPLLRSLSSAPLFGSPLVSRFVVRLPVSGSAASASSPSFRPGWTSRSRLRLRGTVITGPGASHHEAERLWDRGRPAPEQPASDVMPTVTTKPASIGRSGRRVAWRRARTIGDGWGRMRSASRSKYRRTARSPLCGSRRPMGSSGISWFAGERRVRPEDARYATSSGRYFLDAAVLRAPTIARRARAAGDQRLRAPR